MASESMINAIMTTFAAQWRYDFDPASGTWGRQVEIWTERLQPFDDDTVERAVNDYLDNENRPPRVADIRERCQSFRPRDTTAPDYMLDDAPRRGLTDAGGVDLYAGDKKELWKRQTAIAARHWGKLITELAEARQGTDKLRLAKAEHALKEARSPAAYRRWQVYWGNQAQPGAGDALPPLAEQCAMCQGQQVVLVPYRLLGRIPFHWSKVQAGKNDHPNHFGVLYHCPRCVTPTKDEQDYAAPEAEYQVQSQAEVYA